MSANDTKRYFWLKLKKDFFQQHQIKVLKSMPNGRLYALIYLELLAESTSHNGELRYSQMLPYDINTLAKVIDEDNDNLKCAIEVLIKLELVEILEDKTIYMKELNKLIGSETGKAIRMREYRNSITTGSNEPKCSQEYRVKSIENRVKSKDIFIKPTIQEISDYCIEKSYSIDPEYFFNYYESKGWMIGKNKMKNWKAALANWNSRNKQSDKGLVAKRPNYSELAKKQKGATQC